MTEKSLFMAGFQNVYPFHRVGSSEFHLERPREHVTKVSDLTINRVRGFLLLFSMKDKLLNVLRLETFDKGSFPEESLEHFRGGLVADVRAGLLMYGGMLFQVAVTQYTKGDGALFPHVEELPFPDAGLALAEDQPRLAP